VTEPQKNATEKSGFDGSLTRLQQLVRSLESGELSLEDSLKAFEEGVKLARTCQSHLSAAEQRVELLVKGGDDTEKSAETAPFPTDKSGS